MDANCKCHTTISLKITRSIHLTTTEHFFIRNSKVLVIQKLTSKELYWILITTISHKPTSHKYFDLSLDLERNLHETLYCFQQYLYEVFQVKFLNNVLLKETVSL